MTFLRGLRSGLAVILVFAWFLLCDVVQRLVFWPLVRLWPGRRDALMWPFQKVVAGGIVVLIRAGGASIRRQGRVPAGRAVLVLMNHQSVVDVPVLYGLFEGPPLAVITRTRYGRGAPLVSLMLRLLDYPLVDPDGDPRGAIARLRKAAQKETHSLLLFPEGHRSPDGSIAPFESAGIRVILGQGRRPVYLFVTDGYWMCRRLPDFLFHLGEIRGRTEVLGPFEPPESAADLPAFIDDLRAKMAAHLEKMRRAAG